MWEGVEQPDKREQESEQAKASHGQSWAPLKKPDLIGMSANAGG